MSNSPTRARPKGQAKSPRRADLLEECQSLPYGVWQEMDGSLVYFDRRYQPFARLRLDGAIEQVGPLERIEHRGTGGWFYNDATSPYRNPKLKRALKAFAQCLRPRGPTPVNE